MMMSDPRDDARDKFEQALTEYILSSSPEGENSPFVTGWAVVFEYTSADLEDSGQTADSVIVPPTQSRATSRGLFGIGGDHFTR